MPEQIGIALIGPAYFTKFGIGTEGLTVTVDVWEITTSGSTQVATAQSATEVGDGFYRYTIASGVVDANAVYAYKFTTAGTVDQKEVAGVQRVGQTWVENLDAAITTRSSHSAADVWTSATRTLTSFGTLVADTATAVWAAVTRTLTSGAGTAADVWAYATRVLTASAASTTATVSGSTITVNRYDTLYFSLTGLGTLANRTSLYFTVKQVKSQTDAQSDIQIEETVGLKYINRAAAVTAANGVMTIDDASAGDLTISLEAVEVAKLGFGDYSYDIKIVRTGNVKAFALTSGTFRITDEITQTLA